MVIKDSKILKKCVIICQLALNSLIMMGNLRISLCSLDKIYPWKHVRGIWMIWALARPILRLDALIVDRSKQ